MSSPWISPPQGNITNAGKPWLHGDTPAVSLALDTNALDTLTLAGGVLPPGLVFNTSTLKIQGIIGALPKTTTQYPVVFRATIKNSTRFYDRTFTWIVDPRDEEQHWLDSQGVGDLGTCTRGSSVTIPLSIVNPDADTLVYQVVGYQGPPGSHAGLPQGLEIDEFARIIGSPTITNNPPGDYWFRVYARDPDDLLRDPRGEGLPRTSRKLYTITIAQDIVLDARLSDVVAWATAQGSLGSTYETFASHFAVAAHPQYAAYSDSETQGILYRLAPQSSPLPQGLLLDPQTGLILGRCPYVPVSKTFDFTVEARVVFTNNQTQAIRESNIAGQRDFSITILSAFSLDNVTSLHIAIPGPTRSRMMRWIRGNVAETHTQDQLTILGPGDLFRDGDPLFGTREDLSVLLVNGLNYHQDGTFGIKLRDYHHVTTLRLGGLKWARVYDPQGSYVHDILYMGITDPLEGAGGFDALNREQYLTRYQDTSKATAIPRWNLGAQDPHYFPNSIKNLRADLIQTANRQPWLEDGELAVSRGLGLQGTEGLPLWMTCEQTPGDPKSILGYQCAVELACVRAGLGAQVVRTLQTAGLEADLQGATITLDRYLLLSSGQISTVFDGPLVGLQDIITLDGPDNTLAPTGQLTTFDVSLQTESKYYKFPPGN